MKRVERSRVGQRRIERLRRGGKLGPQNRFKRTAHAPAPAKNEISAHDTHTRAAPRTRGAYSLRWETTAPRHCSNVWVMCSPRLEQLRLLCGHPRG